MKNKLIVTSLMLMIVMIYFISCSQPEDVTVPNGGVVITFDDHHFTDWLIADTLLEKYGWRATFCVDFAGSGRLNDAEKMYELRAKGHEIAGHGYNHVFSTTYSMLNGMNKYLEDEIDSMMQRFDIDSINVRSFAYPHGSRNSATDNALLDYFDILRGTADEIKQPENSRCYFDNSRIVFALGLDNYFLHYSLEYFEELLSYANSEGKILIFYAHKPVETVTGKYQVSYETLDAVCKYAYDHNMAFYTLSDLADMIK